jgi:tetratricopeptide (TPR) repeat protein
LAQQYVQVCNQLFPNDAVCAYGQVGIFLANGDLKSGETLLSRLVEEYPQGYLFRALGEVYLKQGEKEKAIYYLLKAVSMSETAEETLQVKSLLQNTL